MPKKSKTEFTLRKARMRALRIAMIYFIFGCIWIILTDKLSEFIAINVSDILFFSMIKGLFYVVITALFVYTITYFVLKELIGSQRKLEENELLFRTIFEQAPIGIAVSNNGELGMDLENTLISMNPKFEQITGRTAADIVKLGWPRITHHEDLKADLDHFSQLQAGKIQSYTMEKRLIKPDGSIVWVDMLVAQLKQTNNHICLVHDITERKTIENALLESERSKSVLLSNLPGLAYRCNYDRNLTMQYVSDGCYALTGYHPKELIHNRSLSFNDIIAPEYRVPLWSEWEKILPQRLSLNYEYEIITATGERKWVLELAQGILNLDGTVEALEGIIIDITDRKKYELELKHLSEHDSWTGLYNRTYFDNLLHHDLMVKTHKKSVIFAINLSSIDLLNLTYGFQYTQSVMKKIVEKLSSFCNKNCQLFSTYPNRFTFYLNDYQDKAELIDFGKSIARALESMLFLERVNGGIGIYEIVGPETDVERVSKNVLIASENALYNTHHNFSCCFFDSEMELQLLREEEIKNELSRIAAGENESSLYLQFQPILNLDTNSIFGFEALARLNSEKLGFVSPVEFIPIAEKTKLIIPIGKIIMDQALNFLTHLNSKGFHSINISINVSAIELLRPKFSADLLNLIHEQNINPTNITLEITESVFSDKYHEINRRLGELSNLGIHIAIDDFGTGYSSLARERELNVDCLKIDKTFMDNLLNPEESITGDIISMAHRLGHYVVAEGVEYDTQREYLKNYHCDRIQGYLISKPLSSQEAIALLQEQSNLI